MYHVLVAVAAIVLLAPQAPLRRESDLAREGLRGAVQTVVTESVERAPGSPERRTTVSRETYDREGNLVERLEYLRGEPVVTVEVRYDAAGNRHERLRRTGGPRRTRLRPVNPVRPEPVVDASGAELELTVMAYNANGRVSAAARYRGDTVEGNKPLERLQFRYTSGGRLAEIIRSEGTPMRQAGRTAFTYGPDGQLTETVAYGPNYQNPVKSTYTYVLDPIGNWVERTETRQKSAETLQFFHLRTIKYYESR